MEDNGVKSRTRSHSARALVFDEPKPPREQQCPNTNSDHQATKIHTG